jgi:Periplasmic protein TonB, links inner and outer membranes
MKLYVKKILMLLISISNITFFASGQVEINQKEFGQLYDINGLPLNNYCDLDYNPEKVLKISNVVDETYRPGVYYDSLGLKHEGLISIDQFNYEFSFKTKSSQPVVLKPGSCLGIKMGLDSFAVINGFEIQRAFKKSLITEMSFAEVIAKTQHYTLFKHTRFAFDRTTIETFVIKTDTSNQMVSFFNKESLIRYFGDCKVLKKQIQNERFKVNDLPSISKIHEYAEKYEHHKRIFYSDSWDEQDDSLHAVYYATISNLKDTLWELDFFDRQGTALFQGNYTSFAPALKQGIFTWYSLDGKVRKKIAYKNDKIENIVEYFPNANPHYIYKFKYNKVIFDRVLTPEGKDVLDKTGAGKEEVFDSILNRTVTKRYDDHKLVMCAYMNGKDLVMLQCDQNARIKSFVSLQSKLKKDVVYPKSALQGNLHGVVLIEFTVDASGNTINFKIAKGLNNDCDEQIRRFLNDPKTKITWSPAKYKDNPFMHEVVVPFYFEISGFTVGNSKSFYFDNWMWRQQWQQQFMQPKIKLPQMPSYRF